VHTHSYTPAAIQQAIKLGVRGIEHGNLIDLETAKMMAEMDVFLSRPHRQPSSLSPIPSQEPLHS
jgi:imidazolonepropionase-like amidohydrolase